MSEDTDYIVLNVPRGTEQLLRILAALKAGGFTVRVEETDTDHFNVESASSSSKQGVTPIAAMDTANGIIAKELRG